MLEQQYEARDNTIFSLEKTKWAYGLCSYGVLHHETLYRGVESEHTTVELDGAPTALGQT